MKKVVESSLHHKEFFISAHGAKVRFFSRENLFAFAFLVILVGLIVLAITIFDPFLGDFFWALIFALTFYPVFRQLRKWLKGRANLASFILTAAILIALLVPGFFVLMHLGKEVKEAYEAFSAISWVERGRSLTKTLHSPKLEALFQKSAVSNQQNIFENACLAEKPPSENLHF